MSSQSYSYSYSYSPRVLKVTFAKIIFVSDAPSSVDKGFFQVRSGELHYPEIIMNWCSPLYRLE